MKPVYTEEEANDILRRAIERMPLKTSMTRDQLESVAAEVGLSVEALRASERELATEGANVAERRAFVASRRRWFLTHLVAFTAAVGGATSIIWNSDDKELWITVAWTCLIPWGIALAFHCFTAFQTRGLAFEKKLTEWRHIRAVLNLTDEQLELFKWPQ